MVCMEALPSGKGDATDAEKEDQKGLWYCHSHASDDSGGACGRRNKGEAIEQLCCAAGQFLPTGDLKDGGYDYALLHAPDLFREWDCSKYTGIGWGAIGSRMESTTMLWQGHPMIFSGASSWGWRAIEAV